MLPALRELCQDDTNRLSSARAISLVAGSTLSFSTVLLTIGSFFHSEMLATLAAFGPSLAGLAGMNYVANRWATKDGKNDQPA